ncbi:hypothetical protein FVE85_5874 [Porphyridium purpureum]|uniref:BZIP domain-containing protein n=1 Tax=Porphyridium purpureum TaxID=35688 RepID=A0A5J4Z2U8_PORPP|nr:hypothetical protein FVE85_5874 [Porphyridium purpureum]|eukprot:POR4988..scf295_1
MGDPIVKEPANIYRLSARRVRLPSRGLSAEQLGARSELLYRSATAGKRVEATGEFRTGGHLPQTKRVGAGAGRPAKTESCDAMASSQEDDKDDRIPTQQVRMGVKEELLFILEGRTTAGSFPHAAAAQPQRSRNLDHQQTYKAPEPHQLEQQQQQQQQHQQQQQQQQQEHQHRPRQEEQTTQHHQLGMQYPRIGSHAFDSLQNAQFMPDDPFAGVQVTPQQRRPSESTLSETSFDHEHHSGGARLLNSSGSYSATSARLSNWNSLPDAGGMVLPVVEPDAARANRARVRESRVHKSARLWRNRQSSDGIVVGRARAGEAASLQERSAAGSSRSHAEGGSMPVHSVGPIPSALGGGTDKLSTSTEKVLRTRELAFRARVRQKERMQALEEANQALKLRQTDLEEQNRSLLSQINELSEKIFGTGMDATLPSGSMQQPNAAVAYTSPRRHFSPFGGSRPLSPSTGGPHAYGPASPLSPSRHRVTSPRGAPMSPRPR